MRTSAIWLTASSDMVVTAAWNNADPPVVDGSAGTSVGKNASVAFLVIHNPAAELLPAVEDYSQIVVCRTQFGLDG